MDRNDLGKQSALNRTIPALAIAALGLAGLAVAPTTAQAATTTSVAIADGYATAPAKQKNYGTAPSFLVDGRAGLRKRGYLKFVVPAPGEGQRLDTVQMLLHPLTTSTAPVRVTRTRTTWDETSLTWATRPAGLGRIGSSNALRAGTTEVITLDVAAVRPGTTLSVRIGASAPTRLRFASSEATKWVHRPALRVTTTPVNSSPPPPSNPPQTQFPRATFPTKMIGMSAPARLWDQRIREVGSNGVTARRIFADLSSSGGSQMSLVREAIADGMMPVISYKVPNPATLANGGYDNWLATLRTQLNSLDAPVTATFWHEPHGDMQPAVFRAASLKFFNGVDSPSIAVGPILNGWLLDRKVSTFAALTDANLLNKWEFVAVDSYHSGTPAKPGPAMPARAIPLLENWMDSVGHPNKPLGIGEYNGFTAKAVAEAGEIILSTPEVWFGVAWNSTAGNHTPLAGDRITAFQRTKTDPRAMR